MAIVWCYMCKTVTRRSPPTRTRSNTVNVNTAYTRTQIYKLWTRSSPPKKRSSNWLRRANVRKTRLGFYCVLSSLRFNNRVTCLNSILVVSHADSLRSEGISIGVLLGFSLYLFGNSCWQCWNLSYRRHDSLSGFLIFCILYFDGSKVDMGQSSYNYPNNYSVSLLMRDWSTWKNSGTKSMPNFWKNFQESQVKF